MVVEREGKSNCSVTLNVVVKFLYFDVVVDNNSGFRKKGEKFCGTRKK